MCETTLVNDEKTVRLISTTCLCNRTSCMLDIRIGHPEQQADSIHQVAPGATLPMPPRHDSSAYRVRLRPSVGDVDWSDPCTIPVDDGSPSPPATASFHCLPASVNGRTWHCILRHDGRKDGICEVSILPSMILTNLLSTRLRFELQDAKANVTKSWTVESGDSLPLHDFYANASLSLVVQTQGYMSTARDPVSMPPANNESPYIKRSINVKDRCSN